MLGDRFWKRMHEVLCFLWSFVQGRENAHNLVQVQFARKNISSTYKIVFWDSGHGIFFLVPMKPLSPTTTRTTTAIRVQGTPLVLLAGLTVALSQAQEPVSLLLKKTPK